MHLVRLHCAVQSDKPVVRVRVVHGCSTLCVSSNAALPYSLTGPSGDAEYTAPSTEPSRPSGSVSQVRTYTRMHDRCVTGESVSFDQDTM